jgi:hypothetical protein
MRESDRLLTFDRQLVVHDVEQLEKGHVGAHVLRGIIDKFARGFRAGLPPDAESHGEERSGVRGDHFQIADLRLRIADSKRLRLMETA